MRPYIIFLGVVLTSAFWHPKALGGPITFFYEGVVTELAPDVPPDSVFASLELGDIFSGSVTFDSESRTTGDDETTRLFGNAIIDTSGSFGDILFNGPLDNTNIIVVINDQALGGLHDAYSINFFALYDGLFSIATQIAIFDPSALMFSDLSLPFAPPDISNLDSSHRGFSIGSNDNRFSGELTTLSLVPEPATLLLLSIGCLVVIRPRKMSTKHTDNQIETSRIL